MYVELKIIKIQSTVLFEKSKVHIFNFDYFVSIILFQYFLYSQIVSKVIRFVIAIAVSSPSLAERRAYCGHIAGISRPHRR